MNRENLERVREISSEIDDLAEEIERYLRDIEYIEKNKYEEQFRIVLMGSVGFINQQEKKDGRTMGAFDMSADVLTGYFKGIVKNLNAQYAALFAELDTL